MRQHNRILIVDDDATGATAIKRAIGREGYVVRVARSGAEALDGVRAFRPDLILLDIVMPGMDGYEVCRRVRADERSRLIKIILLSGKASVDERLRGYEVGADDYLTKPFDVAELVAKLRVFLRLKRAEEVDQLRGHLLVLLGHETRTPLAGIIAMSDVLEQFGGADPDQVRTCTDHIRRCAYDLLDFHKKTTLLCSLRDGVDLRREPGFLVQHVGRAAAAVAAKAAKKRVAVQIAASGEPALELDWSLVEPVVGYVLDNAVKFAPDGSAVRATIRADEHRVRLEVADDGPGIDPDWAEKIFDEFAVRDVNHHQKGQGLSLAIARHVMEHHAGTIAVRPGEERGAVFTLAFPLPAPWSLPCAPAAP